MSQSRFLWVTLPCYLALLWLVSSMSLSKAGTVFGVGAALLAGALWAFRRGWVKPLFACYLGALLAGAAVGGVELMLAWFPRVLTGEAALRVYGGYHPNPDGIYQRDRHLGFAMRPNCSRPLYWNGHWWGHDTNADGYRGERVAPADAVFLGDSMIYGHGVDTEQTVPARFAAHTGMSVANLGQQGTCLLQMWVRFRGLAEKLRPRYVFVCSHYNDVTDAESVYPPAELKRYLAGEDYLPTAREPFWREPARPTLWRRYVQANLRAAVLVHHLRERAKKGQLGQAPAVPAAAGLYVPARETIDAPFAPWEPSAAEGERLGWQVHVRSLANIKALCDRLGARLVLLDLGYPHAFSEAVRAQAEEMGVAYVAAGPEVLRRALAGEEVYLANDGHWNPLGCDLVARDLAAAVGKGP